MPRFRYTGESAQGQIISGEIEADSHDVALNLVKGYGLSVRRLDLAGDPGAVRLSADELNFFNQQLASVAEAKLPLAPALRQLAADCGRGRLKRVFSRLADELESGKELDEAVAAARGAFPPLYDQMMRAGVESGNLPAVLDALGRHEGILRRTRRAVAEALAYPAVVGVWSAALLAGFQFLVAPVMFQFVSSGDDHLSQEFAESYDWAVGLAWSIQAAIGAGVVAWLLLRLVPTGGEVSAWHRLRWRLPLLGRVHRDAARAQLCDAMAMAFASGRDVGEAMELAARSLPASPIRPEARRVAAQYRQGELSDRFVSALRHVPPFLLWSVEVAGPRGDVVATCRRLADLYADRAESAGGYVRLIVAPVAVLLLGWVVAAVLLAVYGPALEMIRLMTSWYY